MAVAVGTWVINIAFEIQCKLLPFAEVQKPPLIFILPAIVRVNDQQPDLNLDLL